MSPWEEELAALREGDLEELEVGSEAWEGPGEERSEAEGANLGAGAGGWVGGHTRFRILLLLRNFFENQ